MLVGAPTPRRGWRALS